MKGFFSSYLRTNLPFWVCLIVAVCLLVGSWFVPPMAVIDSSVLAGVAELFGFGALGAVYEAIRKGTPASVSHGNTTVTVNKDVEENNNDNETL